MVLEPKDLSQSQTKALPDLQAINNPVSTTDSTNESFTSDSRKASSTNKEKDLSDWTSRIALEEWGLLI